ncbi:hypothetical protein Dimus_028877 [Dionaea muscipula]
MVFVRQTIVYSASSAFSGAVCVATRYSAVRRQFGSHNGTEMQVIDYRTQQSRLFSLLASASAYTTSDSLFHRISRSGSPVHSMTRILDSWVLEGRSVDCHELRYLVSHLKRSKRFKHALEVSERLMSMYSMRFSPRDSSLHLDLVSKVHGLDHAEKYFETLPRYFRTRAGGTLLNCYASGNSAEKAEALMQELKNLGCVRDAFPYNVMLRLYYRLGWYEKMDDIMREMKVRGVSFDDITCSIRLSAFVAARDIEGMESFLMKLQSDLCYFMNWKDYVVAANGYLNVGLLDKVLVMLRKAEQHATGMMKQFAYQHLLTMYARAKYRDEVYRLWDVYKNSWEIKSRGYGCIISSLVILGDLEGAEKVIAESLSSTGLTFFAINLLVRAYCEKGDPKKAEALINEAIQSGKKPVTSTWDILATGFCKKNQLEAALDTMKKIGMTYEQGQKLNSSTLVACVVYLRERGDSRKLEEFMSLLGTIDYNLEMLSRDHSNEENIGSDLYNQMELNMHEKG